MNASSDHGFGAVIRALKNSMIAFALPVLYSMLHVSIVLIDRIMINGGKLQTEIEDMDLPNPVIRSLRQRLRQAVRSRSPHAAHRGGEQQRQRLRREQISGKSACSPQCPRHDQ